MKLIVVLSLVATLGACQTKDGSSMSALRAATTEANETTVYWRFGDATFARADAPSTVFMLRKDGSFGVRVNGTDDPAKGGTYSVKGIVVSLTFLSNLSVELGTMTEDRQTLRMVGLGDLQRTDGNTASDAVVAPPPDEMLGAVEFRGGETNATVFAFKTDGTVRVSMQGNDVAELSSRYVVRGTELLLLDSEWGMFTISPDRKRIFFINETLNRVE